MASVNELINSIHSTLDDAVLNFNSDLEPVQRKTYEKILELVKELELNKGKLKRSAQNLDAIKRLRIEIRKVVLSDSYLKKLADFTKAFAEVTALQNQYFAGLVEKFSPPKVIDALHKDAVNNTLDLLTETGLYANVSKGVEELIRTSIRSGGTYAELTDQLRAYMTGKDGALLKYAETITVDSLNTYAATVNDLVTSDLGLQWFMFTGSMRTTSRPMCRKMHVRKYFHLSDIPSLISGVVDEEQTPLSKSTGLPLGFKEETTINNYMQLRNGWRCNHQFIMVTESMVPKEITEEVKASPAYQQWKMAA